MDFKIEHHHFFHPDSGEFQKEVRTALHVLQTQLAQALERLKDIQMTQQELSDVLNNIDTTTNHTAANVQIIADVDQKISEEIDAFLAAVPVGTVITEAQVTQLKGIAGRAQQTSDAGDAQVAVLKAIAAKGEPVVPTPAPTPVIQ